MKKFLVEYSASIGRGIADEGQMEPLILRFFATVEAKDLEAATEQLSSYQDPSFKLKIENISEATKSTAKELLEKIALKDVITQF